MTPTVPVFSALWQFSTSRVMADPGVRHMRVSTAAGQLAISTTDDDGTDRSADLLALLVDDRLAIRSTSTAGDWYSFRIAAAPVDLTTWVRLDVMLTDTGDLATAPGGNDRLLLDFVRIVTPSELPGWATIADVKEALGGIPVSDEAHLQKCTDAANRFCYRRRQQAGYLDLVDVSPGPDATMAVIEYSTALYRERGSVDSFSSFEAFQVGAIPPGTMGQILRLLGTPRPAVDRPPTADEVAVLRRRRYAYR